MSFNGMALDGANGGVAFLINHSAATRPTAKEADAFTILFYGEALLHVVRM